MTFTKSTNQTPSSFPPLVLEALEVFLDLTSDNCFKLVTDRTSNGTVETVRKHLIGGALKIRGVDCDWAKLWFEMKVGSLLIGLVLFSPLLWPSLRASAVRFMSTDPAEFYGKMREGKNGKRYTFMTAEEECPQSVAWILMQFFLAFSHVHSDIRSISDIVKGASI